MLTRYAQSILAQSLSLARRYKVSQFNTGTKMSTAIMVGSRLLLLMSQFSWDVQDHTSSQRQTSFEETSLVLPKQPPPPAYIRRQFYHSNWKLGKTTLLAIDHCTTLLCLKITFTNTCFLHKTVVWCVCICYNC